MLKRLWNDEAGSILSIEIILVGTVLGIGVITGLTSLRDAIITELADVGAAIGNLDQSYTVRGSTAHSSATADNTFIDAADFCDGNTPGEAGNSRCLSVCGGTFAAKQDGTDGGTATAPTP
jgi:hypothetical protein